MNESLIQILDRATLNEDKAYKVTERFYSKAYELDAKEMNYTYNGLILQLDETLEGICIKEQCRFIEDTTKKRRNK